MIYVRLFKRTLLQLGRLSTLNDLSVELLVPRFTLYLLIQGIPLGSLSPTLTMHSSYDRCSLEADSVFAPLETCQKIGTRTHTRTDKGERANCVVDSSWQADIPRQLARRHTSIADMQTYLGNGESGEALCFLQPQQSANAHVCCHASKIRNSHHLPKLPAAVTVSVRSYAGN